MSKAKEFEETHGASYLRSLFRYDPETGKLFWAAKTSPFSRTPIGQEVGTINNNGYLRVMIDGVPLRAHRVIWCLATGDWPTGEIDHDNGDRSDNRIENLLDGTRGDNNKNVGMRSNNTSGFKGVCWHKQNRKWKAQINIGGRHKHLGLFDTPEEASEAYVKAASANGFTHRHIYGDAAPQAA